MRLLVFVLMLGMLAACERSPVPQRQGSNEGGAMQSAAGGSSNEGKAARSATGAR